DGVAVSPVLLPHYQRPGAGRRLGMDHPDGVVLPGTARAVSGGAGHPDAGCRLAQRHARCDSSHAVTPRYPGAYRHWHSVLAADDAAAAPLSRRYRTLGHRTADVADGAAGAATCLDRPAAAQVP